MPSDVAPSNNGDPHGTRPGISCKLRFLEGMRPCATSTSSFTARPVSPGGWSRNIWSRPIRRGAALGDGRPIALQAAGSPRRDRRAGRHALLTANSDDPATLKAMCERATVIITTVGPYQLYGSDLVAACAETGTAYVDLCGEPAWMRHMIDAHHETAKAHRRADRLFLRLRFDPVRSRRARAPEARREIRQARAAREMPGP